MPVNSDKILGINGASDEFMILGNCDICIQGLTSGDIQLQYKLTPTDILPVPTWQPFPGGLFSEDIYKTVFISEHGVNCRMQGVANNAGVYVRLAKWYNT